MNTAHFISCFTIICFLVACSHKKETSVEDKEQEIQQHFAALRKIYPDLMVEDSLYRKDYTYELQDLLHKNMVLAVHPFLIEDIIKLPSNDYQAQLFSALNIDASLRITFPEKDLKRVLAFNHSLGDSLIVVSIDTFWIGSTISDGENQNILIVETRFANEVKQ